jgi:hypothetical protein
MGFSRRLPALRSDGVLVVIKLAVVEQLLDGAQMFIATLEPCEGGLTDPPLGRTATAVLSPRRMSRGQLPSPRPASPRFVRDFAPDIAYAFISFVLECHSPALSFCACRLLVHCRLTHLTRVPVSQIATQEELGKGSAATVWAGVFQGARVALKMFNPQTRRGTIAAVAGEPVPVSPLAELRMEACLMQYAVRPPVCSVARIHTSSGLISSASLSDLRHENVVAMVGISLFPMCIIMELIPCNLYEYLRESVPLNWRLRVSIASDVRILPGVLDLDTNLDCLPDRLWHELPAQCRAFHRPL